jgi:hypothetical protein
MAEWQTDRRLAQQVEGDTGGAEVTYKGMVDIKATLDAEER